MSNRDRLEQEVQLAKERLENMPADTPTNIKKILEDEYVQLSFDLNNFVDEDDNND
ncbi:hypothetical protein [Bacteroides sp. 519]|uniref:hypothetical protein n=1 Tax=Bacteroides sp. 519 TaxID=2302937 RepID=UPI00194024C3|nr:hypothetical protein [Bacteroides sp. 519]